MGILQKIVDVLRDGIAIKSPVFVTGQIEIPGIGTGAAYAAGDAFGNKFVFKVPKEGTIANVVFIDKDDEGLNKELVLFNKDFGQTGDNQAFSPGDPDLHDSIGAVSIETWYDYALNQLGMATPALSYVAPEGQLYAQMLTRGADNIAAGAIPRIYLVIV